MGSVSLTRVTMTILLLASLLFAQAGTAGPPAAPGARPAPPDFAFTDTTGAAHTLAEYRGRVVLLEFWASWCVPCRKGFPILDRLQKEHAAQGLTVVAVTLEEDDAAVSRFLAEHPAGFVVGRDPSGRGGEIFEVAAMPSTFLIDREGRTVSRFEGGSDGIHQEIEKAVVGMLAGGAAAGGAAPAALAPKGRRAKASGKGVKAWERGMLADPIMSLDGDVLGRSMREHIHASKEAAAGDGTTRTTGTCAPTPST